MKPKRIKVYHGTRKCIITLGINIWLNYQPNSVVNCLARCAISLSKLSKDHCIYLNWLRDPRDFLFLNSVCYFVI